MRACTLVMSRKSPRCLQRVPAVGLGNRGEDNISTAVLDLADEPRWFVNIIMRWPDYLLYPTPDSYSKKVVGRADFLKSGLVVRYNTLLSGQSHELFT